jgi:hypothetical protein
MIHYHQALAARIIRTTEHNTYKCIPLVKGEPPVDAVDPADGGADKPLQSLHRGASMAIDSCSNADALMVMISSSSSHGSSAQVTVFLS